MTPRELLRAGVVFVGLTAVLTYPQVRFMRTHLDPHYDSLFSVWRLAWIAHQLPRDPRHLFDANIFFPQPNTLAYSDALLLPGIGAAPLIWMGLPAIAAYNLLVLLSFVLCGLAMYACVRLLTESVAAAWFGSVVFAFQAFRFGHYGQLETLWAWPIPLALLTLDRLATRPRLSRGALLGALVAVQAWSCVYYAVFLITALPMVGLALVVGQPVVRLRRLVAPLAAAAVVAAVLVGPYALPYLRSARVVGVRSEEDVRAWSAVGRDYVAVPERNWVYGKLAPGRSNEMLLFPGLTALAVGAAGLARRDRRSVAYAILFVVAVDLTFGFSGGLYRVLFDHLFVYNGLRVPARFFVLASAALAILGGFGTAWLTARAGSRAALAGGALAGLALLESVSTPLALRPYTAAPPALYNVLRGQAPGAVLEWPLPRPTSLGDTFDPLYMYFSTFHWHPLVSGYSGNYPQSYINLLHDLDDFPSEEAIAALRRVPVRYVVLHEALDPDYKRVRSVLSRRADMGLAYAGSDGLGEAALFELK